MNREQAVDLLNEAVASLGQWLDSFKPDANALEAKTTTSSKLLGSSEESIYLSDATQTSATVDATIAKPEKSGTLNEPVDGGAKDVKNIENDDLAHSSFDQLSFEPTWEQVQQTVLELVERLKGNYPFHSEIYAGQMLKPPHPIAWVAHALTSLINPNNHALDGGPPTSELEKEIIPKFAEMFGFQEPSLGHLTSSGTIANLEALWVSRKEHPTKKIAFSSQAHYTHSRMCEVLGIETISIPIDSNGKWDLDFLREHAVEIGTVVVTLGTTGLGRVEPLDQIYRLCIDFGIRIHIDAAYGGYFKLLANAGDIERAPWDFTQFADSIVIDPHKHGLQPYGCGCVLFRKHEVGRHYKHDSPYTYFSSEDLHLGEISLECSRAGAAAAALWATMRVFSVERDGGMERIMRRCRKAAMEFAMGIEQGGNFRVLEMPELDIVCYFPVIEGGGHEESKKTGNFDGDVSGSGLKRAVSEDGEIDASGLKRDVSASEKFAESSLKRGVSMDGQIAGSGSRIDVSADGGVSGGHSRAILSADEISRVCGEVFRRGMERGGAGVFVSLIKVSAESVQKVYPELHIDAPEVTVLRSVFMKPEHLEAIPMLVNRLELLLGVTHTKST
jgi:glutamate/tyrosine decarboxylase-like PLP-dependent enzyme